MQYLGGKQRIAHIISELIQPTVGNCYIEPFVGGGSVMCTINAPRRIGSDFNQSLITMWRALSNGWQPPVNVSEDLYNTIKSIKDPNDPLTSFIGIGCSFSGKWFGGYARGSSGRDYSKNAANSLKKKLQYLNGVEWLHSNYLDLNIPVNSTIYCDPPYFGTVQYGGLPQFDWIQFWQWCREKSKIAKIYISEYKAPSDFVCIKEIITRTDIRTTLNGKEERIEKIFTYLN